MSTPYSDLSPEHFWRSGVAEIHPSALSGVYAKKFAISREDRIATAGSCFAQHVARRLKAQNFNVLDVEPPPFEISDEAAQRFGYRIYSARYGNLYSARQLLQLIRDADAGEVREEDVWEKDGRFFDALRPSVEPEGLETREEALAHRREHLAATRKLFDELDVLIFTLGLTEAWIRKETGTVYPTCPGVIAGAFDPKIYAFKNFEFPEVFEDMSEVARLLTARNPNFRMVVTVSPVPLTATASGDHVLAATTYSKSTLRAVCGSLRARHDNVDYFPSYEIVTSPASRGLLYEHNLRSVTDFGVDLVMKAFFAEHALSEPVAPVAAAPQPVVDEDDDEPRRKKGKKKKRKDDLVCEEVLLEAFAR